MSTPEQTIQPAPMPSSFAMIRTLGLIAMLSGFLVVSVFEYTKPMIAENKRKAIERAVFQVIPGAVERRDFAVTESGVTPVAEGETSDGYTIYAGYDADGNLKGIAAEAGAQGYADIVNIMFGYDPACECILGFSVLKMAETPGLGDKIITDDNFQANFGDLDASLNNDKSSLSNPIVTVKHGTKKNPWEIDAISGATVTSKAVGKALNDASQKLLPMIWPHLDVLKK